MTIKFEGAKKVLEQNGFTIIDEKTHEDEKDSAYQRSRFWLRGQHDSGFEYECWLRHNLEGHNDNPHNTHRLFIEVKGFSKFFDFIGKEKGPTTVDFDNFLKKFANILNQLAEIL